MYRFGRSAISSIKSKGSSISKSKNGMVSDVGLTPFASSATEKTVVESSVKRLSLMGRQVATDCNQMTKDVYGANVYANGAFYWAAFQSPFWWIWDPIDGQGEGGSSVFLRRPCLGGYLVSAQSPIQLTKNHGVNTLTPSSVRSFASKASEQLRQTASETKKEISTVEDPFDAPTYNIPEKPVTFAEGASYSLIILAGLGVAAAAAYAVFKELIFEPKEYKIFNKALKRIQDDSQVRVRIGSPITGYGQESRNRAARQRIPNRVYTDEFGMEHVEVNFYIRGPHGAGKVYTEMFKDKEDKQWKFTYLIVDINSPSKMQLMLESYIPAAPASASA